MASSLTPMGPNDSAHLPAQGGPPAGFPAGAEPYAPPPGQAANPFLRYVQAIKRFKWLILGLSLAGLAGGVIATRYIDPQYRVNATIWIETPTSDRAGSPIQGDRLLGARAWVELLRSYAVLDPVSLQRKLYLAAADGPDAPLFTRFDLNPQRHLAGQYEYKISDDGQRYTLTHATRMISEEGAVGDSVGQSLGLRWAPRPGRDYFGKTIKFEVLTPRQASERLLGRLTTNLREENFLQVQMTGTDPEEAAATLNALIDRFVEEAAAQKRAKLTMLAEVLDSQVSDQSEKLRVAEQSLESFRVGTVTLPRDETPVASGLQLTQSTVYSQYFGLRTDRDAIRRDREAIQDVLNKVATGAVAVDAFHTIPSVREAPDLVRVLGELSTAEAELRTLLTRYTEEYRGVKDLRERIGTLRSRTVPLYANALVQQLRVREDELQRRIDLAGAELRQIPTRAQTEARFRREVEQADNLFRSLESSRQQARLAEASVIPDVRILSEAVPPTQPSSNQAAVIILIGFLGGLGLGLAIALAADRLDKRFRYPEQVSEGLGLPILGTIPQIRNRGGNGTSPDEAAQVVESFRSVRLNLCHSFAPGTPISLAISSPSPGDGKSLISANLALSFAEAGYRTVLLDGDTRRGDLHRTFSVERIPGLLDNLSGAADLTAVLRPSEHPNLMVIPCGTRRREGPELLGTTRMQDLVAMLKNRFDVILIDTPPLGAGIDPFVLSTATGNLALVLRAGETDRQLAEAKLQILDRLPVRLLGAILNDVRVGEGSYKYYSYSYGYLSDDEPSAKPELPATTSA